MISFRTSSTAAVLLALLISEQSYVLCQDDKRQDLVPFPRIGKRQGLIPFPRIGRSVGQPSVLSGPSVGGPTEDAAIGTGLDDDENNWENGADTAYMLVPDYMKRGGHSAFTPRIERHKRSLDVGGSMNGLGSFGQSSMRRLLPEDLQALFRRTMRQLIPNPRVGRTDAFVPRLGKKSLEGVNTLGGLGAAIGAFDEDTNEEFMVKRGPSAFTPRIGRAAFTPRIGRADPSTGQPRTLRTFTPRIGK
ncbi:uncharacterized protein LOC111259753 [Varroa jacobsoni]|uniref:Uncharacterized protein n=1 Tax=Varroa destructor TaxID=109461 RepID=A0A7M7KDB4_VARDE|nr:uncharacterized protein LOC111250488 [Varroa destructor]XP_022687707.1 uncharacterized protein LOC111259753 [Varroa jacobsoni]